MAMSEIGYAVIILTVTLAAHLVEEVKTGFRKKFPLGELSRSTFIGLNVLIYTLAAIIAVLCFLENHIGVIMAWVFCVMMLLNGAGHIGIMIIKRSYFPGGVTAFIILPAAVWLLMLLS